MSKLRSLNTSFWSDPWIEEITPQEKLLFIYLITNEKTNMLGIYEASVRKISFETGLDKETVLKALKVFERVGKVKYIENHIVLVNFMKHQNYNTNMKKSAIDIYNALPTVLKDKNLDINKDKPLKGFGTLLNHYGMVRKVEVEDEVETESKVEVESEVEDEDVFHDIDVLFEKYISNEKLIDALIKNGEFKSEKDINEKLVTFNKQLKSRGQFSKTWKDYTTHFLNWKRKNKSPEEAIETRSNQINYAG